MTEGWARPYSSNKWHYYRNRMSLCSKWAAIGAGFEFEQGNDESKENCAACKKKKIKENEKVKTEV